MAEYTDGRGILCFSPDDTATEFYLNSNYVTKSLGYILELARAKWGDDIDLDQLGIEAEYIHTDCLGYNRYAAGDYTRYLRIQYIPA